MREVEASCSTWQCGFFTSSHRKRMRPHCRRISTNRIANSCAPLRPRPASAPRRGRCLSESGRNPLRHDRAARVLADWDHLRAGVACCRSWSAPRVELADRIVALQNAARIFHVIAEPSHLRPRSLTPSPGTCPLVTKLKIPPFLPCRPEPVLTVEYLIVARSSATSRPRRVQLFLSRFGAVQPSR